MRINGVVHLKTTLPPDTTVPIGLEILADLPDVDAIVIPYSGGGLSCGIASAVKALKPTTKIYACEVETVSPLAVSLAAGSPQTINHKPSFVDGIGGKSLLPEMWPLVSELLDGALVLSLHEVASTVKLLIERNRVVAEGAGAASLAAANQDPQRRSAVMRPASRVAHLFVRV